jgi:hypothetical protein
MNVVLKFEQYGVCFLILFFLYHLLTSWTLFYKTHLTHLSLTHMHTFVLVLFEMKKMWHYWVPWFRDFFSGSTGTCQEQMIPTALLWNVSDSCGVSVNHWEKKIKCLHFIIANKYVVSITLLKRTECLLEWQSFKIHQSTIEMVMD